MPGSLVPRVLIDELRLWGAMGDDDELAGFDLRLVFNNAVFGNADAIEARTEGA